MQTDLAELEFDGISSIIKQLGYPDFRAKQIYDWILKGTSIENMNNVPKELRQKLTQDGYYVFLPKIVRKLVSEIDGTVKYLFALKDGQLIESVVMRYNHGNTICVSCQAGCRMGCRFCASTLNGLERNLTSSEILGQVIAAQNDISERISNIVMMGIGEPMDNYDNVIKFLHKANDEKCLGIGYRHISISTCGVVSGINKLAQENLPITLSISLHNINTDERKLIMPITNKWSVEELLAACKSYFEKTGRRISFEYTLISGENDSEEHASKLAKGLISQLGSSIPIHVNLIPLNPVSERSFKKSSADKVKAFQSTLIRHGVNATVRRKLGPDINASCGQLRYNGSNSETNY